MSSLIVREGVVHALQVPEHFCDRPAPDARVDELGRRHPCRFETGGDVFEVRRVETGNDRRTLPRGFVEKLLESVDAGLLNFQPSEEIR